MELAEGGEISPATESYGTWARAKRTSGGTVYGGKDGLSPSAPVDAASSSLENTGSLTGHILRQGTQVSDDDEPSRDGNRKVMIIIAVILILLLVGGYLAVMFAHNFMDSLFGGVSKK